MKTQQANMMEAIANMQKSSPQARTQQEFSQHHLQRERPQSIHSLQQEQPKVMEQMYRANLEQADRRNLAAFNKTSPLPDQSPLEKQFHK